MKEPKICVNAITCPCDKKQFIFSANRHDYFTCQCGEVAVDGGHDYLKRTGTGYTEESVYKLENGTLVKAVEYWKRLKPNPTKSQQQELLALGSEVE